MLSAVFVRRHGMLVVASPAGAASFFPTATGLRSRLLPSLVVVSSRRSQSSASPQSNADNFDRAKSGVFSAEKAGEGGNVSYHNPNSAEFTYRSCTQAELDEKLMVFKADMLAFIAEEKTKEEGGTKMIAGKQSGKVGRRRRRRRVEDALVAPLPAAAAMAFQPLGAMLTMPNGAFSTTPSSSAGAAMGLGSAANGEDRLATAQSILFPQSNGNGGGGFIPPHLTPTAIIEGVAQRRRARQAQIRAEAEKASESKFARLKKAVAERRRHRAGGYIGASEVVVVPNRSSFAPQVQDRREENSEEKSEGFSQHQQRSARQQLRAQQREEIPSDFPLVPKFKRDEDADDPSCYDPRLLSLIKPELFNTVFGGVTSRMSKKGGPYGEDRRVNNVGTSTQPEGKSLWDLEIPYEEKMDTAELNNKQCWVDLKSDWCHLCDEPVGGNLGLHVGDRDHMCLQMFVSFLARYPLGRQLGSPQQQKAPSKGATGSFSSPSAGSGGGSSFSQMQNSHPSVCASITERAGRILDEAANDRYLHSVYSYVAQPYAQDHLHTHDEALRRAELTAILIHLCHPPHRAITHVLQGKSEPGFWHSGERMFRGQFTRAITRNFPPMSAGVVTQFTHKCYGRTNLERGYDALRIADIQRMLGAAPQTDKDSKAQFMRLLMWNLMDTGLKGRAAVEGTAGKLKHSTSVQDRASSGVAVSVFQGANSSSSSSNAVTFSTADQEGVGGNGDNGPAVDEDAENLSPSPSIDDLSDLSSDNDGSFSPSTSPLASVIDHYALTEELTRLARRRLVFELIFLQSMQFMNKAQSMHRKLGYPTYETLQLMNVT